MEKPFPTYFGGKEASGVYQKIINEIRPHDVFISGYLGNCAVLRNKRPAETTIGIDLNSKVIDSWKALELPGIDLLHGSCMDLVSQFLATLPGKRVCIYLDPPYRISSRSNQVKVYACEMTDAQHIELLEWVKRLSVYPNVDVLISHYPDELYDCELAGWRKISFNSKTRTRVATENLYVNYSHVTGELHQYDYLGENKDERYNLKHRTAKNLVRKISSMETRKKQAILHYMKELLQAS